MKKSLFMTFVLMMSVMYSSFSAGFEKKPLPDGSKDPAITSLVVNADVNIVLFNDGDNRVRMTGDAVFMEQISCRQTGGRLVVNATKNKNWKNKGVIYIPANSLTSIQVNTDAYVKSSGALAIPKLDIEVNGSCKIAVLTWGEVNLIKNDSYDIEYDMRKISLPKPLAWERQDREMTAAF
jgi:Putative auto-transporter adhesin, head GIN domain